MIIKFLLISGIFAWVIIFSLIASYFINKKKKIKNQNCIEEFWCQKCEKYTDHRIIGQGFNQYMECTQCEEEF